MRPVPGATWWPEMAGRKRVGLQPKRRSIAVVPGPEGADFMQWPLVGDVGETWYCKPQSGKLLVSPADATPVDPHDAYADDMTLAEGIERFQQAVDYEVTRVERTWGGLRSFAPDGNPVVGYDATAGWFLLADRPGRLRHPVLACALAPRGGTGAGRGAARRHHGRRPGTGGDVAQTVRD